MKTLFSIPVMIVGMVFFSCRLRLDANYVRRWGIGGVLFSKLFSIPVPTKARFDWLVGMVFFSFLCSCVRKFNLGFLSVLECLITKLII